MEMCVIICMVYVNRDGRQTQIRRTQSNYSPWQVHQNSDASIYIFLSANIKLYHYCTLSI